MKRAGVRAARRTFLVAPPRSLKICGRDLLTGRVLLWVSERVARCATLESSVGALVAAAAVLAVCILPASAITPQVAGWHDRRHMP